MYKLSPGNTFEYFFSGEAVETKKGTEEEKPQLKVVEGVGEDQLTTDSQEGIISWMKTPTRNKWKLVPHVSLRHRTLHIFFITIYISCLISENPVSSRGGRSGPGRKPTISRREDPPAPTLSQLKAQMEASTSDPTNTIGVLPTHMFGNSLNPASSMAQKMVDTLSQEIEAVAEAGASVPENTSTSAPLVGIPLPGKSTSCKVYCLL